MPRLIRVRFRPKRFDAWRELLRSNVADACQVVETLLAGRIGITPHADSPTAPIVDVRIPLTLRGIFEGTCGSQWGTSPAGFGDFCGADSWFISIVVRQS